MGAAASSLASPAAATAAATTTTAMRGWRNPATTGAGVPPGAGEGVNKDTDVAGILRTLRVVVLAQYHRLLHDFRAQSRGRGRGRRTGDAKDIGDAEVGDARVGDDGVGDAGVADAGVGDEGGEVNDRFFEWQQARDMDMLTALAPCIDKVKHAAAAAAAAGDPGETGRQMRTLLRRCEARAMRGHWAALYGSDEYTRVSVFIRHSLRAYMSALGLEGDAASRGTSETTADGEEVLWTWASVHREGGCHPLHDHPDSLIAGTFYIHVPPDAGRIVFHDPRRAVDHTMSKEALGGVNIAVKPVPGMVVLFPPWLGPEVRVS